MRAWCWAMVGSWAVVALVPGCEGIVGEPGAATPPEALPPSVATPSDCSTARAFFDSDVWPRVIEPECLPCHVEGGPADASAYRLVTPADDPSYLSTNYATLRELALRKDTDHGNRALLELKPTNAIEHGGAVVLEPDGVLHDVLRDFIARVDGVTCDPTTLPPLETPFYEGLSFLDPMDLLRRLALALNGRLPTPQERATVEAGGLDALGPVLDAMLDDEAFVRRVMEAFGDILLTAGYDQAAGAVLSYEHFPNRQWTNGISDTQTRYAATADYDDALRREPIELVGHIVRNRRPFTEILTADYAMVSPYTARGYGIFADVQDQFTDPDDPFEFVPVRLPRLVGRNGQPQPSPTGFFPHAGILSTPQWLHRYPSTDTNRNRARARTFYRQFLGVDVMALAPAVTDAAAVTASFTTPTLEAPDCVACHQFIDPIAGLFQDFDNAGDFEIPVDGWFTDMFAPGYEGRAPLPSADEWRALAWLAEQAVADPRFATAMVEHAWYVLTQEPVLDAPIESGDPLHASRRRAYDAQRAAIDDATRAFVDGGYDFALAVRSLALSDFHRVAGVDGEVTDTRRQAELEALGLATPLTPEQLRRKLSALFGYHTGRLAQGSDSYMLYGGIDQRQVTERTTIPNGPMGAIMRAISNELPCELVTAELAGERTGPYPLFPFVDRDTTDEAAVRDNLVHLHELILGQRLGATSPEIDRSFGLFERVVTAGAARVASGDEDSRLVYECRTNLANAPDDSDYVIRGWQAVITYLLRRPELLMP